MKSHYKNTISPCINLSKSYPRAFRFYRKEKAAPPRYVSLHLWRYPLNKLRKCCLSKYRQLFPMEAQLWKRKYVTFTSLTFI